MTTGANNPIIAAAQLRAYIEQEAQSALLQAFSGGDTTNQAGTMTTQPFADIMATLLAADGGATSSSLAGSTTGQAIASLALNLAGDLRGAGLRSYDPATTPLAAAQTWETPGWGNGNIQCVAFVDGVYRQAGIALPVVANAGDLFAAYQHQPGWQTTANGQGLPQPGDMIAMSGGPTGLGHVAIVTAVTPPSAGQPGLVTFAQSNADSPYGQLTIGTDGRVVGWPGYSVQGFIREGA